MSTNSFHVSLLYVFALKSGIVPDVNWARITYEKFFVNQDKMLLQRQIQKGDYPQFCRISYSFNQL
jgi:hypothetical protein